MTNLRDLQLLAALARHRHFARAAEACGISQPAFSARIRNLETELGTPVVQRGNRFIGLTREGEVVLKWAGRLLAEAEGLRQEIAALKGSLSGHLTVGCVPTALSFAADLPARLRPAHPGLVLRIVSASSAQILRGLEDFSFDAGLSYLDQTVPAGIRATPLYPERYVLLAPPALAPRPRGTASWAEAAALPLCLLSSNMRNRMIVEEVFASLGLMPAPVTETTALTVALTQAASGDVATIVPERLATSLGAGLGLVMLPLTAPEVEKPIGLLTLQRDPEPPAVTVLRAEAEALAR
ncbi:LysR family transcriptional regulator [Oceanicella sp. SM1341]|uniref:LysR family transcriptional regulator n=1 Tax=Oceanicella sp. SM1341 TaxID=1548889 RepID=UPI000E47F6CF|nr:LysR family transcriptional regulator [Oceanicella sp. SM1341]